MKYIIEIPDDVQYVLLNGKADNKYYTAVRPVAELEVLNSDYINEHYGELQDEAYQRGHDDGYEAGCAIAFKPVSDAEYQRGLNDAWEAARRIVVDTDHGGLALGTLSEIFGTQSYSYIMRENAVQEAIDKIKAYDGKHTDRIEVGDEVTHKSDSAVWKAVCIRIDGDRQHMNLMGYTGSVGYYPVDDFKKTGKHYDIQSILEAMRTHD